MWDTTHPMHFGGKKILHQNKIDLVLEYKCLSLETLGNCLALSSL